MKLNQAIKEIHQKLGNDLKVATPLAAGKPNHLLNGLYRLASKNPEIELKIFTALSLEKPKGKSELEKKFLAPFVERVFKRYPDLDYELDRVQNKLPKNIEIIEFYYPAGKFLNNPKAQQNYISSNYTHVARDGLRNGINLFVQQVAKRTDQSGHSFYSLSCNADITLEIINAFKERQKLGEKCLLVAQVNQEIPFMYGDAELKEDQFDLIIDETQFYHPLFAPPKMSVGDAEYMIALYDSALIRDAGELQIGIGALGDALTYTLLLRHQQNDLYKKLLQDFQVKEKFAQVYHETGDDRPFENGMFGATEMMVDGFYHLMKAGIVKRKMYDDLPIQRLLQKNRISEKITSDTLIELLKVRAIPQKLKRQDFNYLQHWGVFDQSLTFESGEIIRSNRERIEANLEDLHTRKKIFEHCLGEKLHNGAVIHAGFFLGPRDFYQALMQMPEDERKLINMRSVLKINQLYGHEEIDRIQRKNARFVNTCLKMTLLGAAVSDGLENGQVLSGIGGQYNFVSMAHALPDGRSILNLRATSYRNGKLSSNIVWEYGHISIPRHLRDIVVTEYGIADLLGKTDSQVIKELLNITDSRFQNELLKKAKRYQKIDSNYQIPSVFRQNYPENYIKTLSQYKSKNYFSSFPFGSDLNEDEIVLARALKELKRAKQRKRDMAKMIITSFLSFDSNSNNDRYLKRMNLLAPKNLKERLYRKLLLTALKS